MLLQYLHKAIITISCLRHLYKGISTIIYLLSLLQISLQVSLHEDILYHLYKDISTTIHLILSLLTSLRCEVIQPYLRLSLQSEVLRSYLLAPLSSEILQSSLLACLRSGTLWLTLLTSLLTCLWKIFLRCLYKNIPTATFIPSKPEMFVQSIHSKPEILLQNIWGFMIVPKQVKPEVPKAWLPLHSLL